MSIPPAITPMVPLSSAPSCAALSMPRASPETTTRSCWPEIVRQPAREAARRRRRVARADDRHRLPVEQLEIALGDQQRRRILQLGKQPRIQPLPQRQERAPSFSTRAISRSASARLAQPRRLAAAAPREVGHRVKRGRRRAEAARSAGGM